MLKEEFTEPERSENCLKLYARLNLDTKKYEVLCEMIAHQNIVLFEDVEMAFANIHRFENPSVLFLDLNFRESPAPNFLRVFPVLTDRNHGLVPMIESLLKETTVEWRDFCQKLESHFQLQLELQLKFEPRDSQNLLGRLVIH